MDHDLHDGAYEDSTHSTISRTLLTATPKDLPLHTFIKNYRLEVDPNCREEIVSLASPAAAGAVALDGSVPQWRIWTSMNSCS